MQRALYAITLSLTAIVLMSGCAATPIREGAAVEIVNEKPQGNCKALGEIIGSQGNWVSGGWTSNSNIMAGARNDLRNKAAAMGGTVVYVQNVSNASAWGSTGTTNTTIVGVVYRCQ